MKYILFARFISVISIAISLPALAAAPDLQSDSELVTAGYYRLSWQSDTEETQMKGDYILEQATDREFELATTLYRGPDTATLISGRPNGTYYYRIRNIENADSPMQWSNVVTVEVAHHSLSRAFMFFILGAVVFVATLVIVVRGSQTHKY